MQPAIRTQASAVEEQELYSIESATDTTHQPDEARQEYKREADINTLLARFGIGEQIATRIPSFGERDYDMDLQTGFIAAEAAQLAWLRLPPELREEYGSPRVMLDKANAGEFAKDMKAVEAKRKAKIAADLAETAARSTENDAKKASSSPPEAAK